MRRLVLALIVAAAGSTSLTGRAQETARFRAGVDLVRVTATVTDDNRRFVTGLRRDDFVVFEDDVRQEISQFSTDRAPVSLGILLDASGSMTEDKMDAARRAIDRFIHELLGREDELFFVEFADRPTLTQNWTTDRALISRAVRAVRGAGNTAIYDAVAMALPKAEAGRHRKKAVLVISDGNDSDSLTTPAELRQAIRSSEVLVYALGIDGVLTAEPARRPPPAVPRPFPFPVPRFPGIGEPRRFPQLTPPIGGTWVTGGDERVNADALRRITDDTGGLTEIIRGVQGLAGATARLADELNRQYDLGYVSNRERDGRWHSIRVDVLGRRVLVRARTGYFAS